MFCYDNGKVCVFANTRCGHTSMTGYFGFKPYTDEFQDISVWNNSKSRRVLVLRNPFDRLKSAILNVKSKDKKATEEYWIKTHSDPYLDKIMDVPFDVIPFENLGDYIPVHKSTFPTHTANTKHYEVEYTPEMRKEYEKYRYLRQHCNVITPEEWKELTENS